MSADAAAPRRAGDANGERGIPPDGGPGSAGVPSAGAREERGSLTSRLDRGVLVLTITDSPCPSGPDGLSERIGDLVRAHAPRPVVIVLECDAPAGVLDAVLAAHGRCGRLGVLMSVATPSAPARRALRAGGPRYGPDLVIHARAETAVVTASTAVGRGQSFPASSAGLPVPRAPKSAERGRAPLG